MTGDDIAVEDLLAELVSVLATAYQEADRAMLDGKHQAITRTTRDRTLTTRLAAADGMLPVACRLARCLAAGDYAGADRLLAGQRTQPQWRQLVLVLASAADLGRLEGRAAA